MSAKRTDRTHPRRAEDRCPYGMVPEDFEDEDRFDGDILDLDDDTEASDYVRGLLNREERNINVCD